MELVVFRLIQVCLTNIHRHSGSKTASIRIGRQASHVAIEVRDQGHGMSPAKLAGIQSGRAGVGIRGMCPESLLAFAEHVFALSTLEQISGLSRQNVEQSLQDQQTTPSTLPPMGWYDTTNTGSVVSGTIIIAGWSWALPGMKSVDVYVDGSRFASANFGLSRPDVAIYFPGARSNTNFQYALDTTALPNGSHAILVKARDNNGNVAMYATQHVTVNN
jgi:hypothetical protein